MHRSRKRYDDSYHSRVLKNRYRAGSVSSVYSRSLLLLVPLNLVYVAYSGIGAESGLHELVNALAPLYFVAILIWLSHSTAKRVPEAIWSPAFWLPLQSAVFFGFGPLVEIFGNEATRDSLSTHILAVSTEELTRSNQLSTLGVSALLFGLWLHMQLYPRVWKAPLVKNRNSQPLVRPETLALAFVLVGGALKYFLLKPAQWGTLDYVVAGAVTGLSGIVDVGFGIMAYAIASGKSVFKIVFWVLWPIHFFLSWLSLSKFEIISAMLMPAVGAFVANRDLRRLSIYLAAMVLVFIAAQPWVHFGRAQILTTSGNIDEANYSERIEILERYSFHTDGLFSSVEERQGWWTRLSFAGPQVFAMKAHDAGSDYSSLGSAWMYFVPRAIWEDKPIMVGPGLEFYRQVTGNQQGQSFLGLSIYGDLYWQFGWLGVILGGGAIGWIFAMMSFRSIAAVRNREFIMMPAVALALEMALLGPNKYVSNGIIGSLPIYIAYLVAANIALGTPRKKRA